MLQRVRAATTVLCDQNAFGKATPHVAQQYAEP
jgi:hypothetical protein